jgi:hypothetical protein
MYARYQPPPRRSSRLVAALLLVPVLVLGGGVLLGMRQLLDSSFAGLPTHPAGSAQSSHILADGSPAPASLAPDPTPDPGATVDPGADPTPDPGTDATPRPLPGPSLDPAPAPGPFAMDLYRKNAFVTELKPIFCVPAAMQTSINIMKRGRVDVTVASQRKLYQLARGLSGPKLKGPGSEPEGWAEGLNQLGYGPYVVDVKPSRSDAIHVAARALRMTGRPVGLLVWRGAHSWVMSGFTATADPAYTDNFKVTGLRIEDVWYPRISSIWGASRPPDALVPVGLMFQDYLKWQRPTARYPAKDGKFVMVLPVVDAAAPLP